MRYFDNLLRKILENSVLLAYRGMLKNTFYWFLCGSVEWLVHGGEFNMECMFYSLNSLLFYLREN